MKHGYRVRIHNIYIGIISAGFLLLGAVWNTAHAQEFIGLGLGAGNPTQNYSGISNLALHGEALFGVHRYCNIWPVIQLQYGNYLIEDTVTAITTTYPETYSVQAALRWFPWGVTSVPLYGSVGTGVTVVSTSEDQRAVGLPVTAEIGYLVNYDNPCCSWFLTLAVRYSAHNVIGDSDVPGRGVLSGIVQFNLPLGGGRQ